MYELITKIKADPVSEITFHVFLKININNQEFQEKLIRYSIGHNIRLDIRKASFFSYMVSGYKTTIKLVEDNQTHLDTGYLSDYILNGYVFGFSKEYEAEIFEETARQLLTNFLERMQHEYTLALKSQYNTK